MTRPINQILSSLLQDARSVGNLGNIEGTEYVPVNLRQASVVSFSREDFEALPADEQQALVQAGYGFGEIRTKGDVISPNPRVHADAFYVVSKHEITGEDIFSPAYGFLTEMERNNVAAYNASAQLAHVESGGGTAMAEEMPLDNRIKAHGRKDAETGYMVLSDDHVRMMDVPELMRRGWFRMDVDGVEQWVREPGESANVLREE